MRPLVLLALAVAFGIASLRYRDCEAVTGLCCLAAAFCLFLILAPLVEGTVR